MQDRKFELDATNHAPRGVWSDGSAAWVSDSGRNRLFAPPWVWRAGGGASSSRT